VIEPIHPRVGHAQLAAKMRDLKFRRWSRGLGDRQSLCGQIWGEFELFLPGSSIQQLLF
jgi:hypothetical protein